MKKTLYPLIAFVLFGCQQPAETPAPATTPPVTPPVAKESPKEAPAPDPDKKDASTPPATAAKGQPGDIAARLYQLRDLAKVTIKAPARPIKLWIMNTESKEAEGMMWLTEKEVKDDEGMIFVFAEARPQNFWMQNTLLPLDITFLDSKGKVLNTVEGKPLDEKTSLASSGPAQYVIELKKGQAAKSGIKPGTILEIPKSVKAEG